MKILFVNFTKFWGGGESWTFQLMNELKNRGHSIVLLCNNESKLKFSAQSNKILNFPFNINKASFLNPFLVRKLKNTIIEINPDVIYLNSTLELKTVGLAIKFSGHRNVIFNRGIPLRIKLDPFKKYLFSNIVTDIIVNSNYVNESFSNISKLTKHKPKIIYHGIETKSKHFSVGGNKNIAIIGRLSNEKGVDLAIDVLQKVLLTHSDAILWVIGDGKDKNKLIKLSHDHGISGSIRFFGYVDDVPNLLVQCSLLIMTSRWEGFGLVLLEAMKLKIPCIAFDHIAASEIIEDNESGYLIPNMDIDLMAEKISYLLSNPDIAQKFGENGNKILLEKFCMKRIIDQYENLLLKYST